MAYVYENNHYVLKIVNGVTTLYKSDAGEPQRYDTAEEAVAAVKNLFGNTNYKIVQELSITKTDTPDTV
jgi:hypothetical protein